MKQEDTISAIATASGEGGIGIVRMSGETAITIAARVFQVKNNVEIEDVDSHRVLYGRIINPISGETVDEGLLIIMRAPRSYTRENVVELHCHGGMIPLKRVLELTLHEGARLAEPGEFTKRAFLNGRLDLSQAQAVMDVIRAKTDASLRMAVGQLEGKFSEKIRAFRHEILSMIAHLEAAIDFPEDDIDEFAAESAREQVIAIKEDIGKLLATAHTGRLLKEGLATAIVGKPNVGKSSLLNALLRESRAIVTDIPGTTRDVIEEYANIGGVPLRIMDTAGIRETSDLVEKIGVEKARRMIESADLILALFDVSLPSSGEDKELISLLQGKEALILLNKSDLVVQMDIEKLKMALPDAVMITLSTLTGEGLEKLEEEIVNRVYNGKVLQGESVFVNSVRQADLLRKAHADLEETIQTIDKEMSPDFIVIDLRAAWVKLGEINGDTVSEDIIDQIFSQFCIGK